MIGRERTHESFPEGDVVRQIEEIGGWLGDGPTVSVEFIFELVPGPSGVSGEGADHGAWMVHSGEGFIDRNAEGEVEFAFFLFKNSEGQIVSRDWTAEVDRQSGKRGKLFRRQDIADGFPGRVVKNEPESTVVCAMLSDENDRLVKDPVTQGGVSQQEAAVQFGRGCLGTHFLKAI